MPDIDKCCIQPRHDLAHLAEVDVTDGKTRLTLLLIEFDEHLVFAQGNRNLRRSDIDNQFSVHISVVLVLRAKYSGIGLSCRLSTK